MENFTAIRNGLREHIRDGKFNPFDLGVFIFLQLSLDWSTGIYRGCAMTIAYQFGNPDLKEHIQRSLRRLRDHQYINYKKGDGARGGYPILIHKFEPTVGELLGTRLNAWKHGSNAVPAYEPKNCHETVMPQWCHGDATVMPPIQDLRLKDGKEEEAVVGKKPAAAVPDNQMERKVSAVLTYYQDATKNETISPSMKARVRSLLRRQPSDKDVLAMTWAIDAAVYAAKRPGNGRMLEFWTIFGKPKTFRSLLDDHMGRDIPAAAELAEEWDQEQRSEALRD